MVFLPGGERFAATNVPLAALILVAYNLASPQCSCQNSSFPVLWERFDVEAKAEHPVSAAGMLPLLQNMLQDRFKLVVRRETKELPAYELTVDRGGPKLHASSAPHTNGASPLNPYHARGSEPSRGDLFFQDETMAELAWRLSTLLVLDNRVVVDKTGLDGDYDFELKFATEPSTGGPSIFTALREQLGLRLEARRTSVEFVTVENAEQPSEN